jgi:hypothetical protein
VFVEEEVFFSQQSDQLRESWTSAGVVVPIGKHIDLGVSYLLDLRRPTDDWTYANVLVTSVGLRF